ncbi:hypothetical protein [Streptomyces sp. 1331.2]|uniref:hypothetical protein n=1 Tax=Streptomyces sp. 1331.2 TaxID=1938835 RepID=UPI00117D6EEC|nr:hypothetical protein [Streptomyces sp. 1331.2]
MTELFRGAFVVRLRRGGATGGSSGVEAPFPEARRGAAVRVKIPGQQGCVGEFPFASLLFPALVDITLKGENGSVG